MTMRRRRFLGLFGAVIAAPAIPMGATAGHSKTAFAAAMAHAQKFPVISVTGLANRCGLSTGQAEAMIQELAAKDMVKLVGPSKSGSVRAASKILTHDPWGLGRTAEQRQVASGQTQSKQGKKQSLTSPKSKNMQVDLNPLLAHLRQLCVDRGMALHPRCFTGANA